MIRKYVVAAVAAAAFAAGPMLTVGPAFAAASSNSPPEPYTAPDPVYTPHKIESTVNMTQPKGEVTLTGNSPSPGSVSNTR